MGRKYYTLLSKGREEWHNGEWVIEFGDYNRACVADEMDAAKYSASIRQERLLFKIITTGPTQADINAKVAELNA